MVAVTIGIGSVAALVVALFVVVLLVRKARARPLDPEERLASLIGPRGMETRDRNTAAAKAKWDAELYAEASRVAGKLRLEGKLDEADKMDVYVAGLRARMGLDAGGVG
jgi:hypothetical protein